MDWSLAWSPDGAPISFDSYDYPSSPDNYILIYDIATKAVTGWVMVGGACCGYGYFGDLTWSPSGAAMAYTDGTYDEFEEPSQPPPVVTVKTYPDWDDVTFAGRRGDKQPAFSPSGKRFAVVNASSGKAKIYVSRDNGHDRHTGALGSVPLK